MHDDDYWVNFESKPKAAPDAENVFEQVGPVDAFSPKSPPNAGALRLHSLLFPKDGKGLSCYALIDAAWVFGLSERLADTELKAEPLFIGDAADELGDVAPWLIKLDEDAQFTRDIFTRSEANWHNWDDEPGVFILSDKPFERVKRQLRRFTKLQQVDGSWVFFRYWDPELLVLLVQAGLPQSKAIFSGHFDIIARYGNTAHVLAGRDAKSQTSRMPLTVEQRVLIAGTFTTRRCRVIANGIREEFPDDVKDKSDTVLAQEVRDALNAASEFGLKDGQARAKFTIMAVATVPDFYKLKHVRKMFEDSNAPEQTLRDLSDVIRKRMKQINPKEL